MVEQPDLIPDFTIGDGLLPAIAQDATSGKVLMLAYMNAESYAQTLATGRAVYYSRSRGRLWHKVLQAPHAVRTVRKAGWRLSRCLRCG